MPEGKGLREQAIPKENSLGPPAQKVAMIQSKKKGGAAGGTSLKPPQVISSAQP
jgi:hypothetical protein